MATRFERVAARYADRMFAPANGESPTPSTPRSHNANATAARFREWRVSELPRCSYQMAPAFWTPARLKQLQGTDAAEMRMYKRREPQITGLAYTHSRIFLVMAATVATYEHVAKLIHCRALMRRDPDYFEHLGKRVYSILLCDDCPEAIRDFARRHHVQVLTPAANSDLEG
jgi:hypothetical protein